MPPAADAVGARYLAHADDREGKEAVRGCLLFARRLAIAPLAVELPHDEASGNIPPAANNNRKYHDFEGQPPELGIRHFR